MIVTNISRILKKIITPFAYGAGVDLPMTPGCARGSERESRDRTPDFSIALNISAESRCFGSWKWKRQRELNLSLQSWPADFKPDLLTNSLPI